MATRGLYLFGCTVFGDTWIANKIQGPRFLFVYVSFLLTKTNKKAMKQNQSQVFASSAKWNSRWSIFGFICVLLCAISSLLAGFIKPSVARFIFDLLFIGGFTALYMIFKRLSLDHPVRLLRNYCLILVLLNTIGVLSFSLSDVIWGTTYFLMLSFNILFGIALIRATKKDPKVSEHGTFIGAFMAIFNALSLILILFVALASEQFDLFDRTFCAFLMGILSFSNCIKYIMLLGDQKTFI